MSLKNTGNAPKNQVRVGCGRRARNHEHINHDSVGFSTKKALKLAEFPPFEIYSIQPHFPDPAWRKRLRCVDSCANRGAFEYQHFLRDMSIPVRGCGAKCCFPVWVGRGRKRRSKTEKPESWQRAAGKLSFSDIRQGGTYPSMSSIKRDVKEKLLPRPEVKKILISRSSPLSVSAHRLRSKGFALACLPFLWVSSFFGDDDANQLGARRP